MAISLVYWKKLLPKSKLLVNWEKRHGIKTDKRQENNWLQKGGDTQKRPARWKGAGRRSWTATGLLIRGSGQGGKGDTSLVDA